MNSNRLWTIGAVVLIVAILALGYVVGVAPKLAEAGAASTQRHQVDEQNTASQAMLAKLQGQYKNLGALTAQLAALQLSMPADPAGSSFVDELTKAADVSSVTLKNVAVSEPQVFAGTTAASGATNPTTTTPTSTPTPTPSPSATSAVPAPAATAAPPAAGQLYTVQVIISVTGSPDQVLAFTNLVQGGPRYFLNSELAFTSDTGSASGGDSSKGGGDSSSQTGTLTGYLFVVTGVSVASPTVVPVPTDTPTSTPTNTPTP